MKIFQGWYDAKMYAAKESKKMNKVFYLFICRSGGIHYRVSENKEVLIDENLLATFNEKGEVVV